ncbi:MAG: hypothetical protein WC563_15280 [Brevundimonas sp.]
MTLYAADFDTFATDIGDEPIDCEPSSDDGNESDQPCMGEGCLNPHIEHSLAECYTLEMCEAQQGDGE